MPPTPTRPTPPPTDRLTALVRELGLDGYDVAILADGSGSSWGRAFGWAAAVVSRIQPAPVVLTGGGSSGTNNVAELQAVLTPLAWVHADWPKPARIAVVTDSALVEDTVRRDNAPDAHAAAWAAFRAYRRAGVIVDVTRRDRNQTEWEVFIDALSKHARAINTIPVDPPRA